jgi:hypothetical protein
MHTKLCILLIRCLKPFLSLETLRMVYYSIVHSVILYSIIFWASSTHLRIVFRIKKRIIRIITNSGSRVSCRNLFKKLSILPFQSQYIFSLLMFVVKNKDLFKMNSNVHTFNTRSNCELHFPVGNLTVYQKGVCCIGIKLYNHLPGILKQISHDVPKFKVALKNFLAINSFYSVEEYYCYK